MSKLNEVKRKGYFRRLHKKLINKNIIDIDENHKKFLFTQYILEGLSYSLKLLELPAVSNFLICISSK